MKYLAILPRIVFPADTGAKIRNLNMFSRLSQKGDEATIVCYRTEQDTDGDVEQMRSICTHLELVFWREPETFSLLSYARAIQNLASRYPYCVDKYATRPLIRRVEQLLAREKFDAVVVDTAPMALVAAGLKHLPPTLCFQHNVEFVIRRRQFEKATNPLLKAFLFYDWARMKRFEGEFGERFDHLIMVSQNDCDTMAKELGVTTTSSVPLGVDTNYFDPHSPDLVEQVGNPASARGTPEEPEGRDSVELVFTGSMDWLPNSDGIQWFVSEVLPLIRKRFRVRVIVVGRRPSREIERIAESDPDFVVTGWVRDVRPFIARGAVYIVPLRIGGGTRIKIFEAMAMARPVVSTTIGAEGLPVSNGQDVLLADSPEEFATAVTRLLEDKTAAAELGDAARRLVVEHFSWSEAADQFAAICERTAKTAHVVTTD